MKKIVSLLLIISMIFAQGQVINAYSIEQESSILEDDSTSIDLEQGEADVLNVSESNDTINQNVIDGDEIEVTYLKIQNKQLDFGQHQEIEIGVENVGYVALSAQLTIKNVSDGSIIKVNSLHAVDNLFTFEIEHQINTDTTYQLINISMENGESIRDLSLCLNELVFTYMVGSSSSASDSAESEENQDYTVLDMGNSLETDVDILSDAIDETTPSTNSSTRSLVRSQKVTIVLDPGHGGTDPGAIGNGLQEKNLNWKISNYTKAYLEKYICNVYLTRTENECPTLEERAQIAANYGANILVSQHVNAGGGTGVEIYVSKNATYQATSTALANKIASSLTSLGLSNRGVKTRLYYGGTVYNYDSNPDYYGVIRHSVNRGFAGIIIEHGFIDNASDAAFLKNESNLKAMGEADAKALIEYYGLKTSISLTGQGYPTAANLTSTGFYIKYGAHVMNNGWQSWKEQGQTSGTTGQSLGIEGLRVDLVNKPNANTTLSAKVYVDGYGWINYDNVTQDTLLGTTGQKADITGISFALNNANGYTLLYRAHMQSTGWTNWTSTDTFGDTSKGYRIEAIEMKIIPNQSTLIMQAHVSSIGWQTSVIGNGIIGTQGKALRLEGYKISLSNQEYTGDITYRAHVQSTGWQSWVKNGNISGTTGKALRVEAVQIDLSGEMKEQYDIYYRAHTAKYGWLDWTKNGETAGTVGCFLQMEALQINLVKKGEAAPGSTSKPSVESMVAYTAHTQTYGWMSEVRDGAMAGTKGEYKRMEAFTVRLVNPKYSGTIEYRSHLQTYGWENSWKTGGSITGTTGQYKRMEAIQIRLTEEMEQNYDVYYRVQAEKYGWMNWAKNGEVAGTEGLFLRSEAVQVVLVEKGQQPPQVSYDNEKAYINSNLK